MSDRILITGGAGFIGKNLIEELRRQDYEVVNLSRGSQVEKIENINIDIRDGDISQLDEYKFKYVIHLAGVSSAKEATSKKDETIETNLGGTKKLLEYFADRDLKKFIFMSSINVYRGGGKLIEASDDLVDENGSIYAYSKLLSEEECDKYRSKMPVLTFRLTNAYGPYQRRSSRPNLIPQVIPQAINEKKIEIYNGNFSRDFIYISDVVNALISGLQQDFTGTLNLGTGMATKTLEIAKRVAEIADVEWEDLKKNIKDPLELVPDTTLIRKSLGWESQVGLEEGLRRTWEYYVRA